VSSHEPRKQAACGLEGLVVLFRRGVAAALLVISGTRAQDVCPAVADADQLVRCALAESEAVSRARLEIDASRARLDVAHRFLPANPTLEVGGGPRSAESGKSEYDRSVDLAQTFEIGGQRGARIAIASTGEQLAGAALDAIRREIAAEVLTGVVSVWRARAGLAFASEQRELATRLVEVSAARQRQGLGPAVDVDLAQAALVQARRDEAIAAQGLAEADASLARTVGRDVKLAASAPLPPAFQVAAAPGAFEDHAVAHRREALSVRAEAQAGRAREELLRRERIPDVTVSAGVRHEEFSNVLAARLSVPIPLVRRNQGEIAEQQARVRQADTASRQVELRVRLEVRAAFAAWQRAKDTMKQIEPGLEERLRADTVVLREAYARGTLSLANALASLREAQGARRNLVEIRGEAVLTSFQLALVAGYAVVPDPGAP
jgi:cobalt-zinc-cadmium efflux system outer membrane protein